MCDALKLLQIILIHFFFFFTNIASDLVSKLSSANNMLTVGSDLFKMFYNSRNPQKNAFTIREINEDFVSKVLKSVSKSSGLDSLPARFIKDGAERLKNPITVITNMSIRTGTVPDEMKFASVQPIFKKNSP